MNTATVNPSSTWARALGALALAAGAWALSVTATPAQARDDIYWSVGVHSPGVSVGVSNAPTVVYSYPQYGYPVYSPRPVVVHPRPVVVYPRPVVVHPYPAYGGPRWHGDRRGHRHWKHHGHRHGHQHGRGRGWDD